MLLQITIAAQAQYPAASQVSQNVNLDLKDIDVSDALKALFNGSGKSYSIDASVSPVKVSAVLKDIPFDSALKVIVKAAGLVYRVENGVYIISSIQRQMSTVPQAPSVDTAVCPEMITEVIDLDYVIAGDVAPFVKSHSATPLTVTATSGNRIILRGTEDDIESAKNIIRALDTENALPRPVRLKLAAKITVATAKGPKIYETSTESVGAEQTPVSLQLQMTNAYDTNYSTVANKQVVKQKTINYKQTNLLDATIMPAINADGSIGLSGIGHFSFPFGKLPGDELTKDFSLTASVDAGKPYTIAAGSIKLDIGKVDFVVTVIATPEKGRVYVTPQDNTQQHGGYGSTSGYSGSSNQQRNW